MIFICIERNVTSPAPREIQNSLARFADRKSASAMTHDDKNTHGTRFFFSKVVRGVINFMQATIQSEKLCWKASEVRARLSISSSSLYKLVKAGTLVPVASINRKRHRLFNVENVLALIRKK